MRTRRPLLREAVVEQFEAQSKRRTLRNEERIAIYARYPEWRRRLVQVVESSAMERSVYVILVANCVLLGIQNIKSLDSYQAASDTLDWIFTFCFLLEMIVKIAAHGVGFRGGYLSRYWNWIDGSITIASVAATIVRWSLPDGASSDAVAVVGRAFRLIRPLRMLTALSSLRTLLRALGASMARLGNVAILTAAFLTFMSLIALAFFRFIFELECQSVLYADTAFGSVVRVAQSEHAPVCVASGNATWWWMNNSHLADNAASRLSVAKVNAEISGASSSVLPVGLLDDSYSGVICPYGQFCLPGTGPDNGYSNFNSIFSSAVLLYTILSLEGWSSIMFYVTDALGDWVAIYFIVNVVIGTIFVLNLVLATIADGFNRSIRFQKAASMSEKRRAGASASGASSGVISGIQHAAASVWNGFIIPAALSIMSLPEDTVADKVHKLQEGVRLHILYNRGYQVLRQATGMVSVGVLATTHYGMSPTHETFVLRTTSVLTCWFALENALEVIGLGPSAFLRDPIRVCDSLVSIGALVEVGLQSHPTVPSLRMVRLVELLLRFPSLRKQIRVLLFALKDTLPLLLFMAVLLFLAALLGMQLFSKQLCMQDTTSFSRVNTSLCDNVPRLNFDNVGYSSISVFVIFCGDGWRDMMALGMQSVGDYTALYFCFCYLIGGYLMLNLFVAIMISRDDSSVMESDGAPDGDDNQQWLIAGGDRLSFLDPVSIVSGVYDNNGLSHASSIADVRSSADASGVGTRSRSASQRSLLMSEYDEAACDPLQLGLDEEMQPVVLGVSAPSDTLPSRRRTQSILKTRDSARSGSIMSHVTAPSPARKTVSFLPHRPTVGATAGTGDKVSMLECSANLLSLADALLIDEPDAHTEPRSRASSCAAPLTAQNMVQKEVTEAESLRHAEELLADEVEYDLVNRKSDLKYTFEQLREQVREELNRQVEQLPWVRRVAGSMVKSRRFVVFFDLVVIYSMATMMVGRATDYPDSVAMRFRSISDMVVAVLFLVEALLKMTHHGLLHEKRSLLKGYFNYRWNIFDGVLMVLSFLVAAAGLTANATMRSIGNWLRICRVLRPFSLIGRRDGLKVVAKSAIASIPHIRNVGLLTVLVWLCFAILGTQLFSGRFMACTSPGGEWGDQTYQNSNLTTRDECLAQNFTWVPPVRTFDDVGASMLSLFQLATVDNWVDIMLMGVDSSSSVGVAPHPRQRIYLFPYFIVFILLTTFFLIQYFVASMCDVYFTVKQQMEESLRGRLLANHEVFLDAEQKQFLGMYRRALYFVKPPLHVAAVRGTLRSWLRRVVRHKFFEPFHTVLAIVHIVIESLVFAENPPVSLDTLYTLDWVFTGVFVALTLGVWVVYGMRNFLESSRGRWALLINIVTTAGLVLEATSSNAGASSLLRQMRVFRLMRIFYLTHAMQLLIDTLVYSLPSFANVFFLLFLVFFLYASVGMQLFGRVKFFDAREAINRYSNFDRFDKALIALLRVATFDDWTELMYSCAVRPPDCDEHIGECPPHPIVSYLYFFSFAVVGQWIGINFFTAEIIDAFSHAEMEERYAVQQRHVIKFQRLWKQLVGSSEGPMPLGKFATFLEKLGAPLGPDFRCVAEGSEAEDGKDESSDDDDDEPSSAPSSPTPLIRSPKSFARLPQRLKDEEELEKIRQAAARRTSYLDLLRFMSNLDMPVIHNHVLQGTAFDALMRHFYQVPLPAAYERSLRRVLNSRFQTQQYLRYLQKSKTATEGDLESIRSAVDFSLDHHTVDTSLSPSERSAHPYWVAYYKEAAAASATPFGDVTAVETLRAAVSAIRIQSWWRGARIRELVRMATQRNQELHREPFSRQRLRERQDEGVQLGPSASTANRQRRQSVIAFDTRRTLPSIAERLKRKHMELI